MLALGGKAQANEGEESQEISPLRQALLAYSYEGERFYPKNPGPEQREVDQQLLDTIKEQKKEVKSVFETVFPSHSGSIYGDRFNMNRFIDAYDYSRNFAEIIVGEQADGKSDNLFDSGKRKILRKTRNKFENFFKKARDGDHEKDSRYTLNSRSQAGYFINDTIKNAQKGVILWSSGKGFDIPEIGSPFKFTTDKDEAGSITFNSDIKNIGLHIDLGKHHGLHFEAGAVYDFNIDFDYENISADFTEPHETKIAFRVKKQF